MTDGTSGLNHRGAKNHIYADRLGSPFPEYTLHRNRSVLFCFLPRAKNKMNCRLHLHELKANAFINCPAGMNCRLCLHVGVRVADVFDRSP